MENRSKRGEMDHDGGTIVYIRKGKWLALLMALTVLLSACGGKTEKIKVVYKDPVATTEETADWRLLLVNASHPQEEDYTVELSQLTDGHAVDQNLQRFAGYTGRHPKSRNVAGDLLRLS